MPFRGKSTDVITLTSESLADYIRGQCHLITKTEEEYRGKISSAVVRGSWLLVWLGWFCKKDKRFDSGWVLVKRPFPIRKFFVVEIAKVNHREATIEIISQFGESCILHKKDDQTNLKLENCYMVST